MQPLSDNSPHILCVNPWIHDFAAFDFWAKPLGLLQLAAIIREGGCEVSFLDCLDRFHLKAVQERGGKGIKLLNDGRGPFRKRAISFPEGVQISDRDFLFKKGISPEKKMFAGKTFSRYGIEPDWLRDDLKSLQNIQLSDNQNRLSKQDTISKKRGEPDLILVTSLMTYWASGVRETISVIKEIFPDVPIILGGIYATLCTEHARKNSMADEVVTGRGEEQIYDIIKNYTGFSLESSSVVTKEFILTKETMPDSSTNLDSIPYPALDLVSNLTYAPVLTSRGCPFSCNYCVSSFLEPRMRRRSPESVFQEICHWYENYGVENFAFYDDALLINPEKYILPLLEKIVQYPPPFPLSFHTPNALHIREITKNVADMMFKAGFRTIRLGLETTNFSNSRKDDSKVRSDEFYNAVSMLKLAGFQPEQIGAYLLCALPGQNLDDVERSVKLVREAGITPVLAYYSPIPHTKMWKDAVSHSRFDLEKEPFFTNNTLLPCVNNEHDIKRISELKRMARG